MAKKEYIERETAYPLAKKICDAIDSEDFQRLNFGMRILDWIDDLPAAEVKPAVRGKWEEDCAGAAICSVCNEYAFETSTHHLCGWFPNFCPNCGADMREES